MNRLRLTLAAVLAASPASALLSQSQTAQPSPRTWLQCRACHTAKVEEANKVGPNLSKLFGAQRFKDYQDRIAERRRALKDQTEAARTELRVLLGSVAADDRHGDGAEDELAWIDAVVDDSLQDVQRAADVLARAAASLEEARQRRDVAERQHRRRVAEQVLADLGAHRAEVEELRARVETAERAERVRALADAVRSAAGTMEAAREAIALARVDYGGSAPDDALREEVTRLDRAIGALAEALADPGTVERYAERYAAWQARFNARDDGHASERVVARILDQGYIDRA